MGVRVIPARNLLQTTLWNALQMINNRQSPEEICIFIHKRLEILVNPPDYVRIDWNNEQSESYVDKRRSPIDDALEGIFG